MMVDWVSGFVEARAALPRPLYDTGQILRVKPGGEFERIGTDRVQVEGSHDSRVIVKAPQPGQLYLSGNPAKFLQGHNLFGSADAVGLFLSVGLKVREAVGLFPSAGTWHSLDFAGPDLTRLDLTRSYRFPSDDHARAWLRDVAPMARSRHGGAIMRGGTVYFGQSSERWAFKVYLKSDELRAQGKLHRLAVSPFSKQRRQLEEWAAGVVRFELTLRSKELVKLGDLGDLDPLTVWQTYFDRITWNRNAEASAMADIVESDLSPRLRGVLALWRQGDDLRRVYSRPSFYRYRRELLEAIGVDIAAPAPKAEPGTAPGVASGLDPKGWDPEPIKGLTFEPDPQLKLAYRGKQ